LKSENNKEKTSEFLFLGNGIKQQIYLMILQKKITLLMLKRDMMKKNSKKWKEKSKSLIDLPLSFKSLLKEPKLELLNFKY